MRTASFLPLAVLAIGCASSQKGGAGAGPDAGAVAPDADSFTTHGLTVTRPEGWVFVPPDSSVPPDTVAILQGSAGEHTLAPVVEISRRKLDAAQRRRKATHIVTQVVMEMTQLFEGFEMVGEPEDQNVAGQPGARIQMNFTESLPDGQEVKRDGTFYGVVYDGNLWIIRCLGAPDGSHDSGLKAVVESIALGN